MIVSTSGSVMQSMTIETSRRSSTRASKARSAGSAPSSVAELGERPAGPVGMAGGVRDRGSRPSPGSTPTFSQPEMPCAISVLDPGADLRVAERGDAVVDAERQQGRRQDRWPASSRRPCTGTGRRRRRGPRPGRLPARATASPARPHTALAPHLRCETWSRAPSPAARTVAIASSSASNRPSDSLRMCVAYRPPRRGRGPTSAAISLGPACMPGRVDQPDRQPERAGVDRRLDLGDHRRAARRPSAPGRRRRGPTRGSCRARRGTRRSARAAARSTASRYSANVVQRAVELVRPQGQRRPGRARSSVIGASVSPQLPESWVVNPWWRWLASAPSTNSEPSEWPCGSMNPGVTTRPVDVEDEPDLAVRSTTAEVADREDPVAEDADVGAPARRAGAVDDGPAAEEQVERGHAGHGATSDRPPRRHPADRPSRPSATLRVPWGYSSAGRASAWHAEGPGFESP